MLLACHLLRESAEQQEQRFVTTTGKEKSAFFVGVVRRAGGRKR